MTLFLAILAARARLAACRHAIATWRHPPIPDFLTLPDRSPDPAAILRTDLATLRQCVARPWGTRDGDIISKAARDRLIAARMLLRRRVEGEARTRATRFGIRVARANASCRDGTEPPLPPRLSPAAANWLVIWRRDGRPDIRSR